jgi:hypothetical protein
MRSRRTVRGGVVWGAWCVVLVGLWGCSGGDSGAAAPGDAGIGGEPADDANVGTSVEAAPASDGATSGSSGQVVLYTSALRDFTSFGATFTDPTHPQPDPACKTTGYGMCSLTECAYPGPDEAPRPHAGEITFLSSNAKATATITPDNNGLYPSAMPTGIHLSDGESVRFTGQGDVVPAFDETASYPDPLLMSAPSMPSGTGPATAPRTRDLQLTWTGGTDDVSLRVHAEKVDAGTLRLLDCTVASVPGSFKVPHAALQAIGASTDLNVDTTRRHTFQAGAYTTDIFLGGEVLTPNKMRAVTIQVQ